MGGQATAPMTLLTQATPHPHRTEVDWVSECEHSGASQFTPLRPSFLTVNSSV